MLLFEVAGEMDRMNPRHPAQPLVEQVARSRLEVFEVVLAYFDFLFRESALASDLLHRRREPRALGRDVDHARPRPGDGTKRLDRPGGHLVLEQGPFPAMVEDRRPEQPDRAPDG